MDFNTKEHNVKMYVKGLWKAQAALEVGVLKKSNMCHA